jgi:hypothetical protein
MYQSDFQRTDFRQMWYWRFIRESVKELQIWSKSDWALHAETRFYTLLTAVRKYKRDPRISTSEVSIYASMTAQSKSTIQKERIVAFPLQQFLSENTTMLGYMYSTLPALLINLLLHYVYGLSLLPLILILIIL